MSNEQHLAAFIARQRLLLSREREEEITRGSLLLTNCGTKLLEQKGLAITGLGVVDIKIGLGGKMCVRVPLSSRRLPPMHTTPLFSTASSSWNDRQHTIPLRFFLQIHFGRSSRVRVSSAWTTRRFRRPGDLARIDEHSTSSGASKKTVKAKKKDALDAKSTNPVEGVVYKVCSRSDSDWGAFADSTCI